MNSGDKIGPHPATLILNASPDSVLLNNRSRALNNAGYYTSSAQTPEQAAQLVANMNCNLALVCYSFTGSEKKAIFDCLRNLSPGTAIVCLEKEQDENTSALVSRIEQVLTQLSA